MIYLNSKRIHLKKPQRIHLKKLQRRSQNLRKEEEELLLNLLMLIRSIKVQENLKAELKLKRELKKSQMKRKFKNK